jgi:hypothetical protein
VGHGAPTADLPFSRLSRYIYSTAYCDISTQTYNLAAIPRNYSPPPDCTSRIDRSNPMNGPIIVLDKIKALRPMTVAA